MKKIFLSVLGVRLCHTMGLRRNFSRGGEKDILLMRFRLLTMQRKLSYTKTLFFLRHKKCPLLTATVASCVPSKKIYTD